MSWYAAHLIVYFKRKKGPQKRFLVWENIVLIRAKTSDEAYEKAEQLGQKEEASEDDTIRIGGHPCRLVFAGVRKVTLCENEDTRPSDGTEVTYNEWGVRSEAAIKKLVAGKTVALEILDPFPDDETLAPSEPTRLPRKTGS
jgi:hypothetical protein